MSDKPRVRVTTDGEIKQITDGYGNIIAGMGQGRDKSSRGFYVDHTYTNDELVAAYETSFLPRRIVDAVAEDATRRWRNWNGNAEDITKIEKEEQRVGVLRAIETALKNARLLGGAAIYFPVRGQRPETPFEVNSIGKGDLRKCIVFSQNQLSTGDLDTDFDSDNFGKPLFYQLSLPDGTPVNIHHSRIIPMYGSERPLDMPLVSNSWSRSVLQTVLDATKVVDGSVAAIANLVLEARIDVVNIKGLMNKLRSEPTYEGTLLKRFAMASMSKSVNGTLLLDEDEKYQQKSQTYGSLPELLDRFFQYVSGSCGIPVTRLFGTSPGGLNATGEADIRHYYDRVQTLQNNTLTPAIANFDEALIRSATGRRPKNIFYTWRSLWQVTEKERSEIGLNLAKTSEIIVKNGMIDPYSMGQATVTALAENESMPGIEDAWDLHQTIRSKPVDPVDLNKVNTQNNFENKSDPANENSPPADRKAVNDERGPRSLYVSRKVLNTKDIINWAKSQGIKDIYPADELHVTIIYSETAVDWMEMGEDWYSDEEFVIPAGGPRVVDIFGIDDEHLVLRFVSSRLKWRRDEMIELGASSNFKDFKPHITISKNVDGVNLDTIEPYTGKIVLGPEIFEEIKSDD